MITVMLSLVLVIGLFAGCGKDGGTSAGPVKDDGSVVIRVPFASEPSSSTRAMETAQTAYALEE